MRAHLKKIFAGIHDVLLDDSGSNIKAMMSSDGEIVKLSSVVNIDRPVEVCVEYLEDFDKTVKYKAFTAV